MSLQDILEDYTNPLPVEKSQVMSYCKRCEQKFPGNALYCPECRIQQEQRVILLGPTANPELAAQMAKPKKRNMSPAGREAIRAARLARAERERAEKQHPPKPVLELVRQSPLPQSKPAPAEDAYAIVAALARTNTFAHLRAALALKELLEDPDNGL